MPSRQYGANGSDRRNRFNALTITLKPPLLAHQSTPPMTTADRAPPSRCQKATRLGASYEFAMKGPRSVPLLQVGRRMLSRDDESIQTHTLMVTAARHSGHLNVRRQVPYGLPNRAGPRHRTGGIHDGHVCPWVGGADRPHVGVHHAAGASGGSPFGSAVDAQREATTPKPQTMSRAPVSAAHGEPDNSPRTQPPTTSSPPATEPMAAATNTHTSGPFRHTPAADCPRSCSPRVIAVPLRQEPGDLR